MKTAAIGLKELKQLYTQRMTEDFPPSELRPLSGMEYLLERSAYRCYVFREGEAILAYALFALSEHAALLDYLAVDPAHRGEGIGTKFLAELKELLRADGIDWFLIEAESLQSAGSAEETAERQRRFRFYKNCGCRSTGTFSLLFGVEYEILLLPTAGSVPLSPEEVKGALEELYRLIVPPVVDWNEEAYGKVCSVFLRPESEEQSPQFARELGRSVTWLYRRRSKFMGEKLRQYGLVGAMYMILLHVNRHPGTTQDNIATQMYLDKSNVARRIKQLEELGYLRRETDQSDRRQNNLYLTDRGRELAPVIRSYLAQWGQTVTADLTEQEKNTLLALLGKMLEKA